METNTPSDAHRKLAEEITGCRNGQHPEVIDAAAQLIRDSEAPLIEQVRVLREALAQIVAYGNGRGDGCCPYGCDTPTIAHAALAATYEHAKSGNG